MKKRTLRCERLEEKKLLAGDVALVGGGTLVINGTNQDDFVQVDQVKGTRSVEVNVNGKTSSFDGVKTLVITGGNGNDDISVNTLDDADFLINSFVFGGNGNDIIQGGGGNDYLDGGNGDDILSTFVTDENYNPIGAGSTNVLIGGNGNDSLWGGWGVRDILLGGNGNDTIYDIVGGSNYIDGGNGNDFIIARGGAGLPTDPLNNPGVLVSDFVVNDKRDSNVVLFDAATQANGPVVIGNTLYVLNLGGGDITVDRDGKDLVVNYNGDIFTFDAKKITTIAGLGGPGNDTFVNNTNIKSVFYGLGGDDVLLGGSNDDVLKGGDGNDYIDGRGGKDDITGDAGADTLNSVDGKKDIVRVDALDTVFTDVGLDRLVVKRNLMFS